MTIRRYHEQTKHHLDAYAPGPGALDWANQPDPFRRYAGAPLVALPLAAHTLYVRFNTVRAGGSVPTQPLGLRSLGALLEISLGLSAWKVYRGSSWALRCNPSSGNLHPTEGYLVCPRVEGLEPGVYHYASREHALERRAVMEWGSTFPQGGLIVGLSAIVWREAWKYGARAYRYCQHDAGHAIAAIRYACAVLGWRARVLEAPGDATVSRLLGLDREVDLAGAEPERPDTLLWVGPGDAEPDCEALAACPGRWQGRANQLSPGHVHWPQIQMAEQACVKPGIAPGPRPQTAAWPPLEALDRQVQAVRLITQRRSAMAFDGRTVLSRETFFRLLDATLPRSNCPPWDALPWGPRLHLVLFVHRVRDLAAGLYLLARRDGVVAELRQALGQDWLWQPVPAAPAHLALHLLLAADTRETARTLACHQDIAADSAFSLGMLGEFEAALAGSQWRYRELFWEAGVIGQVLYLEAEAAGLRGTGIGCYFDDAVHRLLGLSDTRFQDLYHFTVGTPVEDTRLRTLAPYAHLDKG
jgi:SagB-type dehydrogenase family enzyme